MVTIEISWEEIKFFLALVVAGCFYGWYVFERGKKKGWDDAIYSLENFGVLYVDEDGDVCRVSDEEYEHFRESMGYQEE